MMLNELRLADFVLIALVLVSIFWTARYFSTQKQQDSVYVYKDNALLGVYSLDKAQTVTIDEHNSIEIKDGKVRMSKADCPDKRCVKQGFSASMPIICLPNHLIIEVKASDEARKLILH